MRLDESVARRLRSEECDRWMHNVASTGYCHNPVRLVGSSTTLHEATGEILSEYSSASEPDGVTFTRCGNRRATRCESCSHEYKGDTWHMIMAGAAGGMKEVPEEVAEHPMVFLTLTAPSFGAVHTTAVDRRVGVCEHGKPRGCRCHHDDDDPQRGDAVCAECYDYVGHVVWQYHAPELWRRFTIRLRRELARSLGMTQRSGPRRTAAVREGRRVPASGRRPFPRHHPARRHSSRGSVPRAAGGSDLGSSRRGDRVRGARDAGDCRAASG